MSRIVRSNCSRGGITRRRCGKGFSYYNRTGRKVADPATLDRITALVIPPAWSDVWICDNPNGHIQAVGFDAAGRKQYLYHARWRSRRDKKKFARMPEFAHTLPAMRHTVAHDLGQNGMPRTKVLALAVRLIDLGLFRIGNEEYTRANGSYGLATIRTDHVKVSRGGTMTFDFIAKAGKRQVLSVADPEAARVVRTLKRRRGNPELLAYREEGSRWVDVKSSDVNEYLKTHTGGFTAKDFRTWSATVLAAAILAESAERDPRTPSRRVASEAVKRVAAQLGNTPAVCRSSYISPQVLDEFFAGVTIAPVVKRIDPETLGRTTRERLERAVAEMLEGGPEVRAA